MSKKNVTALVSGGGMFLNIMSELAQEVQRQGGTELQLHRLATPEGHEVIKIMAEAIVAQDVEEKQTLAIPYDVPLETLIAQIPGLTMSGDPNIPCWPNVRHEKRTETLIEISVMVICEEQSLNHVSFPQKIVKEALVRRNLEPVSLHALVAFIRANFERIMRSSHRFNTFVDLTDHRNKRYERVAIQNQPNGISMYFLPENIVLFKEDRILATAIAS